MHEVSGSSHLGLYRTGLTGPEHRRKITVGRSELFDDAIEVLNRNVGKKAKHHQLFVGPRGIGKTHLLSLIEDEISGQPKLTDAYHVVRFPEESNRVLSYADFLLGICENLRDTLPDETEWQELYDRLAIESSDDVIVDTLVPAFRKRRRETRQNLVIMMENLNQVFDEQIKQHKSIAGLRGFLMEDNGCLLIATAPLHFSAISDPNKPFYDFFDIQTLEQLSDEETIELIRRNLEWEKKEALLKDFSELRPKLLALYRMTGGSPRLTLMLYELIANESVTEVKKQFHLLLDRITPFYQDRMNDLGPQERSLLETMAVMRDQQKTPTSIAERMRMKTPQVSTLLGRLAKSRYLKKHDNPADKRSNLYTIREGLFDIWLAMNVSRGERARLPFLLDFFAEFYPTLEERNRKREMLWQEANTSEKLSVAQRKQDVIESLDYLSELGSPGERMLGKIRLMNFSQADGDRETAGRINREISRLADDMMGRWIVEHSTGSSSSDYLADVEEMIHCWETYRSGDLEAFAGRIREMGEGLNYSSWSKAKIEFLTAHIESLQEGRDRIETRLRISGLLRELALWDDSEDVARKALHEAELFGDDNLTAWVLNDLAMLLKDTNRLEEAELLVRRALAIGEKRYGKEHPSVAIPLNNLALLLKVTNRLEEAEPLMRQALAIGEKSYGKEHHHVAVGLNNLAQLLKDTNRLEEAEPLMRQALAIDEKNYGKEHPHVAVDLNNLAQLLQETNRLEEAEPLMRQALAIDEKSYGKEHPHVAVDLNNLARLLQETNRLEDAEPLMKQCLEKNFNFKAKTGHWNLYSGLVIKNYINFSDLKYEDRKMAFAAMGKIAEKVNLPQQDLDEFLQSINEVAPAE